MKEEVSEEKGEEYAKSIDAEFLLTSAKTEGPKKFENFLTKLYEKYLIKIGAQANTNQKDPKKVVLNNDNNVGPKPGKKFC